MLAGDTRLDGRAIWGKMHGRERRTLQVRELQTCNRRILDCTRRINARIDSEVFRKNERGKQKIPTPTTARKKKIVVDEKAAKRHKSELMLKNDLMFSG